MKSPTLHPQRGAARVIAGLLFGLLAATVATGQTAMGEPSDLRFAIVNATTGEPTAVARLTIAYVAGRANMVLDLEPNGAEFTLPQVPIKDVGEYLVTVWYDDVPYWWSKRGHQLMGETTTLHVFDVSNDPAAARISGLNLVARRLDTVVDLEYMLQVDNAASPQVTLRGDPTIELTLPAGVSDVVADYFRGPEPTRIPVQVAGAGLASLDVPLTPGANRIRVTAKVGWAENMDLPIAASLPIDTWSLLISPTSVVVKAMELESGGDQNVPGYGRYGGPPLEVGRRFSMRLASGPTTAGQEDDLFTTSAASDSQTTDDAVEDTQESGGFSLPLVLAGIMVIIIAITVFRRRNA